MSKTADMMWEKYVEPLEKAFFDKHGRWPEVDEEQAIWTEAWFQLEKDCAIRRLEIV